MREQAFEEYKSGWRSILEAACKLEAKEGANIARMLNQLQIPSLANSNSKLLDRFGFRICGQRVKRISDHLYEAPLFELQLQHEILRNIEADTRVILELGSGYSKNLFRVWLNGGPLDALYIGAEYTEAGRECGEFLAALEPKSTIGQSELNLYDPNFADLIVKQRHTYLLVTP